MAQTLRYRDLQRPALVDTSVLDTGDAQTATRLAGAFKQFERQGAEVLGGLRAEQGAKEGATAGASGTPEIREGVQAQTAYGAAYNNAAMRSYAIKAEAAAEDAAARIEVESGSDPDRFRTVFGAFQNETLKAAPPAVRGMLTDIYNQRMGQGTSRLTQARAAELNKQARTDISEGISRSTDRIANLRASDDPADHARAEEEEAKLQVMIDSAHADGTISEVEAGNARVGAMRDVTKRTVVSKFKKTLDDPYGDPVEFINRLKKANETSEALPPAEEEKLVDELMTELRERNALDAAARTRSAAEEKAKFDAGDKAATSLLLGGELTQRKLKEMVDNSDLDPGRATALLNELQSGDEAADDTELAFHVRTNLLDYEEADIATMKGLKWKTRSDLILKRREEATGWKSTQAAREADDRIDRALGIAPGTNRDMLTPEEAKARDTAKTQWYSVVDALPPNERQAKVMELADDVIGRVIRKNKSIAAETARQGLERYKKELGDPDKLSKKARKAYDDEIARGERLIQQYEAEAARK